MSVFQPCIKSQLYINLQSFKPVNQFKYKNSTKQNCSIKACINQAILLEMNLIFAADQKFINGTCRFKKKFQSFPRSNVFSCYRFKLNYFINLNYFRNVNISKNACQLESKRKNIQILNCICNIKIQNLLKDFYVIFNLRKKERISKRIE